MVRCRGRTLAALGVWLALLVAVIVGPGAARAEKRVALVIGNGGYSHAAALPNPARDAQAMADRLRALDFSVVELRADLDFAAMYRELQAFQRAADGADVAALFYAGHGIEVDGRNYLVPVDAKLASAGDVEYEAVPLDLVMQAVSGARRLRLVMLDACRNNPFLVRMERTGGTRSIGRGLARVEPSTDTLVAYAAKAGAVAEDGDSRNSPFTTALLAHLGDPGVEIGQTFRRVRDAVLKSTAGRQEPVIYGALGADAFYLAAPPAAQAIANAPATSVPAFDSRAIELAFWQSIKDSDRSGDFEAYLRKYPEGNFAELARVRLEALKASQVASLPPATAAVPAPAAPSGPSIVELDDSYVTLKTSNLRSEPTTEGSKVGTLGSDTLVQATGKLADGSWVRIAHSGSVAWVWGKLVEPVDAAEHGAWTKASGGDAPALEAFLKAYPRGRYAAAATARLASLRAPPPSAVVASPAPAAKPVVGVYPQSRGPGATFQDCADCPEMVVLPQGTFTMGSPSGEEGRHDSEGPQHRVRIGYGLAVGKYEVTFEEWDACVSAGGCSHRPDDKGWGRGRRPVMNVSWNDAQGYVRWLSRTTGERYRLLSEAEWEYAARAGTQDRYSWGDGVGRGNANCDGCGSSWDKKQTAPVGSFGANRYGLHDMHGNVFEWVEDCWSTSYAGASEDGSALERGDCGHRVLRGGSWLFEPGYLRSAVRGWGGTGDRDSSFGFRVARTL